MSFNGNPKTVLTAETRQEITKTAAGLYKKYKVSELQFGFTPNGTWYAVASFPKGRTTEQIFVENFLDPITALEELDKEISGALSQ